MPFPAASFRSRAAITLVALAGALMLPTSAGASTAGAADATFGLRGTAAIGHTQFVRDPDTYRISHFRSDGSPVAVLPTPDGTYVVPKVLGQSSASIVTFGTITSGRMKVRAAASVVLDTYRHDGSRAGRTNAVTLPKGFFPTDARRLPDGRIVLLSTAYRLINRSSATVAAVSELRLLPDGSIDPTLAGGNVARIDPANLTASLHGRNVQRSVDAMVVQPDGRLQVVLREGTSGTSLLRHPRLVLAAATSDGSIDVDVDFAGGSVLVASGDAAASSEAHDLALAAGPSGSTVLLDRVTVEGDGGSRTHSTLSRYDLHGVADSGWNGGAPITTDYGTDIGVSGSPGIDVTPDGGVFVVEGTSRSITSGRTYRQVSGLRIVRYASSGTPDSSYGTNGSTNAVLSQTTGLSLGRSLAPGLNEAVQQQSDGKLLVTGRNSSDSSGAVVFRLTTTGQLDPTWGSGGSIVLDAPSTSREFVTTSSVRLDSGGQLVSLVMSSTYGTSGRVDERYQLVRRSAGDAQAAQSHVDIATGSTCGHARTHACFFAAGRTTIHGVLRTTAGPVRGAAVQVLVSNVDVSRSFATNSFAVQTDRAGRFTVPVGAASGLGAGRWSARVSVSDGDGYRRISSSPSTYFDLGPRHEIDLADRVRKAAALSSIVNELVDDSIDFKADQETPNKQCASIDACMQHNTTLDRLVSDDASLPVPGHATLHLGKPGRYVVRSRVDTDEFDLTLVSFVTADDEVDTCVGDVAARKKYCPGGSWSEGIEDAYALFGLDYDNFD